MLQVVGSMIHLPCNIDVLSPDVEDFDRYCCDAKVNKFIQLLRETLLGSHPTLRRVVLTRSPSNFQMLLI